MTSMQEAYKAIKGCIVAFIQKYIPVQKDTSGPPLFPPITGTGFVVREDGLVVTNAHVAKAFNRLQNVFEKGRNWVIKSINPADEETRIQEFSRLEAIDKTMK